VAEVAKEVAPLPSGSKLSVRRILKGHLAKIYAMDWAPQKVRKKKNKHEEIQNTQTQSSMNN